MHCLIACVRIHHKLATILMLMALLLCASMLLNLQRPDVYALSNSAAGCTWYKVRHGDTLSSIARRYDMNVGTLAQTNHISNVNLIISGRSLCIQSASQGRAAYPTTQANIAALLRKAAARYNVPVRLVMAIAWEESG